MHTPELVRIDLPGKGSGFTLRHDRWLRVEHVEFLSADGRVWLFREMPALRDFLASDAWPPPYWRDLVRPDGRALDPAQATRHNLWQMVDGTLRWSTNPWFMAGRCSHLCVELAFCCESSELLDELDPCLDAVDDFIFSGIRDYSRWRRIIPLVVSLVRFWGEPDEPIDLDAIHEAMTGCFFHGP